MLNTTIFAGRAPAEESKPVPGAEDELLLVDVTAPIPLTGTEEISGNTPEAAPVLLEEIGVSE